MPRRLLIGPFLRLLIGPFLSPALSCDWPTGGANLSMLHTDWRRLKPSITRLLLLLWNFHTVLCSIPASPCCSQCPVTFHISPPVFPL